MGFTFVDSIASNAECVMDAAVAPTVAPTVATVGTPSGTPVGNPAVDAIAHAAVDAAKTSSTKSIETTKNTIFVGNVPLKVASDKKLTKDFLKLFSSFGKIISHRFRSIAFEMDSKTWKRSAFLNQKFNSTLKSTLNAYIVYESFDKKVLELNGKVWENHHLRVDDSNNPKELVPFRSIFIGNLPLDVSEEDIWDSFSEIGNITNVRLVRDKNSQVGKGFGFIEFSDKGSVSLALKHDDLKIKDRVVRITSMKKSDSPAIKRLKKKNASGKTKVKSKKSALKSKKSALKSKKSSKVASKPRKNSSKGK